MGGTEHLTVRREGATLVLTLNRPEAKNALSLPMLVGLYDGWIEADEDDAIRSIVLTGAGVRSARVWISRRWPGRAWRGSSTGTGSPPTLTCTGRRCCATIGRASR